MRVLLTTILVLLLTGVSLGQDTTFRKNTISVESGIFSRGLLGISYSRKFLKTDYALLSADIFAGMSEAGPCIGAGFNLNLGRDYLFFVAGIDCKQYELQFYDNFLINDYYFKGIVYNPYLGLSAFVPYGFTVKLRAGLMPVYRNHSYDWILPSVGASIGHSF
ncbi:MAG: hypothetical protein HYZ14_04820 [Bacteroidetes bacterium]|nr:hypothetical protein [Bacteroidota bacterium]